MLFVVREPVVWQLIVWLLVVGEVAVWQLVVGEATWVSRGGDKIRLMFHLTVIPWDYSPH